MTARQCAEDFFFQHVLSATDAPSENSSVGNDNSMYEYLSPDYAHPNQPFKNNLHQDDDTSSLPSLSDYVDDDSDSEDEDIDEPSTTTVKSDQTPHSIRSNDSRATEDDIVLNADDLPLTFLQLRGISVGNYNMNGNFRIETAIRLMFHYKLDILAVQEHTPWNRELFEGEIKSIERHCDRWGFFVTISPLQILIIDKQLTGCHRESKIFEDGRIITSRFEISDGNFVTFVPVYGIPHSGGTKLYNQNHADTEDVHLQKLSAVRDRILTIIRTAKDTNDIIYVFGDLQDTPDNSKKFHYGPCRLPKHPLGIASTCENLGLSCSIYKFLDDLEQPIISRRGTKGGRFIDGLYTCTEGLEKITGTSIINDTGVFSDHHLVINKIDLGIAPFQISKEKEERIDFKKVMNIPVHIKPGDVHPTLNHTVFQGEDYQIHAQLYETLQNITLDPKHAFLEKVDLVRQNLEALESEIVARTKATISLEEQKAGKLIERTAQDAVILNNASAEFFTIITDICREADLASKVPIVPSSATQGKRKDVISGKIMPGIASIAITKSLENADKRVRTVGQRMQLLIQALQGHHIKNQYGVTKTRSHEKWKASIALNLKRLAKQQEEFITSLESVHTTCKKVKEDRLNHIQAIEHARHKKLYDSKSEFVDTVIETVGKKEYDSIINDMKKVILGKENVRNLENEEHVSPVDQMQALINKWQIMIKELLTDTPGAFSQRQVKHWYKLALPGKQLIKNLQRVLKKIKSEEFHNSKIHNIRIGKYGSLARMTNPKERKGPAASAFYPTKTGEPIKRAYNNQERMEASIETHKIWVSDPPGNKNCHFLDLKDDDVGPNAIDIDATKPFDEAAEWNYLEGLLKEKVCDETAERVKLAHQKLPELFRHIKTETKITYPFKYDCLTGEYMHPELEANLRKNVAQGNGKARATGFAIPVLGRLPKIFLDVYLLKCKLQMTLRLLDVGTECSLRICIGKPCGGVRPLTVGHDDNVFLNGLAQQAIQKEIARLKIIPENVCSYQKGKGCADATIVDGIVKEVALQDNRCFVAELDDDAEKMFDRLYLELQIVLLLLAGAGMQGFTEWQSANMINRTNRLVTDIFVALLEYKCGLPQGSGFSVEIANLYAMFLLMWWNMDPINPAGVIVPFTSPRHGFPLIAEGIIKSVASLAYVDDAKRFVSVLKSEKTVEEFFEIVQGYCDLLADLSLVIKMGRNVRKCTIYLYNIPEDVQIPVFTSIAWSYDARGPIKGIIKTVVMRRDSENNLIYYDVPKPLRPNMPAHVQDILATRKYLGVATNAQLDATDGKEKMLGKLAQRIGLVSQKADSIKEAQITHNMLVCQVAIFSPICISMNLSECSEIDKKLLTSYQYKMQCMPTDAKHRIFLSCKKGGIGVRSFTSEYIGALLRDIEVYISNENSLPAHALLASIEAATAQCKWNLFCDNKFPTGTRAFEEASRISLSGKKIVQFFDNAEQPSLEYVTYDFTHTMERAVTTTSRLGFMLRDMDQEFLSRFIDELLLQDRKAKAIGSASITTRASMGAYIGKGNVHFAKYSLFGRIYILLLATIDEAKITATTTHTDANIPEDASLINILTQEKFYGQLKTFFNEIAAAKLANTARSCYEKYLNDYKIGSFFQLIEWRCYTESLDQRTIQKPRQEDYRILIDENKVFRPSILRSMRQNSEALSKHLQSILSLDTDALSTEECENDLASSTIISNEQIMFLAMQHDLPIFVSIDGSLEKEAATTSISIVAPHIFDTDEEQEWQHRPAKVLLTRSWRLPKTWGTSPACINMAESIGLILGEYTIPSNLPVIYILDSNNARTLQRKICHLDDYTHRQKIRNIKQGIDASIANHLEYLTSRWPRQDQLSQHTKDMYTRGEAICKLWATPPTEEANLLDSNSYNIPDLDSADDDNCSTESEAPKIVSVVPSHSKSRYRFDHTMYDCLTRVILVKVYSHQLTAEFEVKDAGNTPKPNLFVVSANQFADNAASQAVHISRNHDNESTETSHYPIFSPRWCFSFEGRLTTKGATKILQDKSDDELILRLQERPKQGLFARLAPHTSLSADQIGDESILRSLIKMTAPCPTRSVYRYPPLANQIWKQWRDTQTEKRYYDRLPANVPKDWQKRQVIRDYIILACPFCSVTNSTTNKKGNLEHVHVYCPCKPLQDMRSLCNQKIEAALHKLYDFASVRQYNCPFHEAQRMPTLQEKLIAAAKRDELEERKIIRDSKVIYESRSEHKAIRSRSAIQQDVHLNRLPPKKLAEYDRFPLTSQLGLIHAIPEHELDMATATVMDVVFLGLFPKHIYKELQAYARELERQKESDDEFTTLFEWLVTTVIFRAITIQKVVQILLSGYKKYLDDLDKRRTQDDTGTSPADTTSATAMPSGIATSTQCTTPTTIVPPRTSPKKCYATKCQLLRAKGILSGYKTCSGKRNACSGCSNEASKQRLIVALEKEMLLASVSNAQLAPLLVYQTQPTSLKAFRKILHYLPSLANTARNDYKFGASTYLANTLGILIHPTESCRIMDDPLPTKQINNIWRQALLFCRCQRHDQTNQTFGGRTFCMTCLHLMKIPSANKCQGCNMQEPWTSANIPCLSCQFAAVAFRNPFQSRLAKLLENWLPLPSDSDDSSRRPTLNAGRDRNSTHESPPPAALTDGDLIHMRTLSYTSSFSEIRSRSSPEQNMCVIENITLLQQEFKKKHCTKRDLTSAQSDSQCSENILTENMSPRKRPLTQRQLFTDDLSSSKDSEYRIPLAVMDINTYDQDAPSTSSRTRWAYGSQNQIKKNERTLKKKLQKKKTLT